MLPVHHESHYIEIWTCVPPDFVGNALTVRGRVGPEFGLTKKFVRPLLLRNAGVTSWQVPAVRSVLCLQRIFAEA
jgi:hypothetical protein